MLMAHASQSLALRLVAQRPWFDEQASRRILRRLVSLLRHVVDERPEHVWRLSTAGYEERRVLRPRARVLGEPPSRPDTIQHMFAAQTSRTPNATAIRSTTQAVTYRQLEDQAHRVTAYLRDLGAATESLIGLCLNRTPSMVAGMLGILGAGAAYVPLDPRYPAPWLGDCIRDAGIEIVLTDRCVGPALRDFPVTPLAIEDIFEADSQILHLEGRQLSGEPSALAYLLYTSGSTGAPKGVAIEQRNAASFLAWAHSAFSASQMRLVLATTSISFDLSIFEIFVPLTCGGAVALLDNALDMAESSVARTATLLNTVPSVLATLVVHRAVPKSVTTVNVAGEPLTERLAADTFALGHVKTLLNLYGPTETTTYSTVCPIGRDNAGQPPIGQPISGTTIHLLDAGLEPVPLGAVGEIHIGGHGVARGYWQRPALSADRFVPDPFSSHPGTRLYRTGDLGRMRPDGTLEFLGRIDRQVKVRGYRIELEGLEHAARAAGGISDALAVPTRMHEGLSELVLYVVPEIGATIAEEELQRKLGEQLPSYMCPAAIVTLPRFPLTPNGKIDVKKLRPPASVAQPAATRPATEVERIVAECWARVLPATEVALDRNFFDAGGNSLRMFHLLYELRASLNGAFTIVDLYRYPTIRSFCQHLQGHIPAAESAAIPDRAGALAALRKRRAS
jgi:amino acid adenylation domain-containing protein